MATAEAAQRRPFALWPAARRVFPLVAAWCVGVIPALAVIHGSGGTTIYGPVQAAARPWLVAIPLAWVCLAAVRDHPMLVAIAGRAALVVACVLATHGNVGARYGFTTAVLVLAADAALVDHGPGGPQWAARPAWGLAVLVAAGALWSLGAPLPVPLAGAVIASGLRLARARRPDVTSRFDAAVDRALARAAGAARGAAPRIDVAMAVVVAAAQVPILHRYASKPPSVVGSSDFHRHLIIVRSGSFWPLHIPTPHPLFHLSVLALVSPLGEAWATTVVLAIAAAILSVVLVALARRTFGGQDGLTGGWAAAFVVGYLLWESPAVLAHALRVGRHYDWAPSVHMFLSPTDDLLIPFALALVMLIGASLERPTSTARQGGVLAATCVACALAKPSLVMALFPAIVIHLTVTRRATKPQVRFLATWIGLPVALVGAWQIWFLRTGGGTDLPPMAAVVKPFDTIRALHMEQASPLLFSALLIVPLCMWAGGRRYLATPAIALSCWSLLVGYAYLILVNETGPRRFDGTFAKPAYVCGAVLVLLSLRFLLGEAAAAWRAHRDGHEPVPTWFAPAAAFAVISVASGVIGYLESVGLVVLASKVT
jgi:hypothetical protein